jgi:hypothetical protein
LGWVQNQAGKNHAHTENKSLASVTSGSDRWMNITPLSLDTAMLDPAACDAGTAGGTFIWLFSSSKFGPFF